MKKKKNVFISVLVLALASLACNALTGGSPDVTEVPATVEIPIATDAPTETFTLPDLGTLFNSESDDFSSSDSGWGTGTDTSSLVEYEDGGLRVTVFETFYVTWSQFSIESYENVHLEITVKNESTDPDALFGFVCNEQGSTTAFYYVGVSPNGDYAFIESSIVVDDIYLAEGNSDLISASADSMRLGLDCGKDSMTLYVNDQVIDSAAHSSYTSGVVGLFAATDDEASGASVVFDDFDLTKLGE